MKKISLIIMIALLINLISGCSGGVAYNRYSDTFFDSFDTVTQVIGYTKTQEEFDDYMSQIHDRMLELHKMYDKYNTYEGINNIKTINHNAGKEPVEVSREIIDLITFAKEMYYNTHQKTNIAFGSVLSIWSEYRDDAEFDPSNAKIPPIEELQEANKHTDLDKVIVDEENMTVYLEDPEMSLDVGAVAKGFATEMVVDEMVEKGFDSWIISAGGNIRSVGEPKDPAKDKWGIGIQNPDKSIFGDGSNILDTVFMNDISVVSSGDYQRYYVVDDQRIHHIIDPETLMPASHYRAVNVVIEDSGLADYYSTEVFLLPYEESRGLVQSVDGLEAIWVFADGRIEMTEGFKLISRSGGSVSED
ncbi:MAG: FAD:protein FMN transferase [Bacillota bacterium]